MAFTQYLKERPKKWSLDKTSALQDLIFSIDQPITEKSEKTTTCQRCGRHTIEVFQVFCNKTSLHGLQYVGEKGHTAVRLFWALIIMVALGSSVYHILKLYKKWEDTPVMVTLSPRVKKIQEVYFPAVTICAPRILTQSSEKYFLNKSYENTIRNKEIVDKFCNLTKEGEIWDSSSFEDFPNLEPYTLLPCRTLFQRARFPNGHGDYNSTNSYVIRSKAISGNTVIDCCTFNGLSEDEMYRNIDLAGGGRKEINNLLKPTGIGIRNEFKYELDYSVRCPSNFEFKVSIHHPAEAPNVEGDGLIVKTGARISHTVKPQDTEASDSLKSMKPEQRGCQFSEDVHLRFFRNYTQHNCMLDCLANFTLKMCECLPPYLPEIKGALKLCNESQCFSRELNNFRKISGDICKCEQSCADTTYLVTTQYVPSAQEDHTIKFDVYFTESTFFSYYRSELYGLSDFLSSCGGLLGLFMGFSVISMIEVFYFSLFGIWRLLTATFKRNRGS